jgi:hypothetical protein
MNTWSLTVLEEGITQTQEGIMELPELRKPKDDHPARVSMTVGRSIQYGEVKISATVSLACTQDEDAVDEAAKLAFLKALEIVNDGMGLLVDAPRLDPS